MSSAKTKTYHTSSSRETQELGFKLGQAIIKSGVKKSGAVVLAMKGDLGAGKTTFTQGLMKGLGSRKHVTSPTFILMRRHALGGVKRGVQKNATKFGNVFHIDAYRLKSPDHFAALELADIIKSPANIVIIEWPEQAKKFLPKHAIRLQFKHGRTEHERTITIAQ